MSLPKRFPDRDEIAAVRADAERLEAGAEGGDRRRLAGRVMARREMGKLAFLDLVDRSGKIQLLWDESRAGKEASGGGWPGASSDAAVTGS